MLDSSTFNGTRPPRVPTPEKSKEDIPELLLDYIPFSQMLLVFQRVSKNLRKLCLHTIERGLPINLDDDTGCFMSSFFKREKDIRRRLYFRPNLLLKGEKDFADSHSIFHAFTTTYEPEISVGQIYALVIESSQSSSNTECDSHSDLKNFLLNCLHVSNPTIKILMFHRTLIDHELNDILHPCKFDGLFLKYCQFSLQESTGIFHSDCRTIQGFPSRGSDEIENVQISIAKNIQTFVIWVPKSLGIPHASLDINIFESFFLKKLGVFFHPDFSSWLFVSFNPYCRIETLNWDGRKEQGTCLNFMCQRQFKSLKQVSLPSPNFKFSALLDNGFELNARNCIHAKFSYYHSYDNTSPSFS